MASKLKVSEIFYSLQGEGRYLGVPSVFLRTFGCNFMCQGFGMHRGALSDERLWVFPKDYKSYNELPLVHSGCDSYAAWDVRFKHLSPVLTVDEVANRIVDLLPHKKWTNEHLILTGGEPLLGWQRAYPELLDHPRMLGLKEVTIETNGTQKLQPELSAALLKHFGCDQITFSVSAKLPMSGEKWEEAIRPEIVAAYQECGYTYLKFVVGDEQDVEDVDRAVAQFRDGGFHGPVYLMPVGGTDKVYGPTHKEIANLSMKKGYRYSPRLQVELWKNAWGT